MHHINIERNIAAPADVVWNNLASLGEVYKFHPGVETSPLIGSQATGLGAARVCNFYDGNHVTETITEFDEGHSLVLELTDFSLPLKEAALRLVVEPVAGGNTKVSLFFAFQPKFGPLGWLMAKMMIKPALRKALSGVIQGLESHIKTGKLVGENGILLAA